MPRKSVIAIDGPAGAGKSTIAKLLSQELGYRYVDTGAMYRALTWKALRDRVPFHSPEALSSLAKKTKLRFVQKKGVSRMLADGEDVTGRIRTQRVTRLTNTLAAVKGVRQVLRQRQREMGREGGVVMEGRDIGTAVFPQADFKFYLDASPMERALRRYRELKAKNKRVSLDSIAEAIRQRDYKDRTRGISPLKVAPGATVIDTTKMTLHDVFKFILNHVRREGRNGND
ncbi:MAG TPA: (d)CMP kinase [Elusimicrobiota bacterium]|nr:(d)CMP kinase [Elusimicrobiota bacterium]